MDTKEQLNHLSEIRSLMERSSRCLSLSGLSGISAGIIAIICGLYTWWYLGDGSFAHTVGVTEYFLSLNIFSEKFITVAIIALVTLVLAIVSAFIFTYKNSQKKGLKIWDTSTKYFLINLFIPLTTGGFFCLILAYYGELYLLASSTLIFYGLALLNASRYTHREIRYLGVSEIFLGLISSLFIGYGIIFWLFGFGVLHIIYGAVMYLKYERE
ncbi:hypothetical protein [Labilibacter marinus]|uniref:hypothetical protein n=1 Tax=Labilibacter marinus TaxID=1477105 RepID=UPI0008332E06|nr:hypothetical protein [Labilibacter marinus]